jgi:glycosyltransferase involved in cell wall biosynthesis
MRAPVSVVIPCYNCKETIKRAVDSVWVQTLRPAEVIIVDDGSNEETRSYLREIIRSYESGWIKLIEHENNKGPGSARNTGWDNASQPYIAFLDSDDSWHPKKIELQYNFMVSNPAFAITGHRVKVLKKGETPFYANNFGEIQFKKISGKRLLFKNVFVTSSIMLLNDLPFRFESSKRYGEDYLLWLNILLSGYAGAIIEFELGYRHKQWYGFSGLSAKLWDMEKKEINSYYKLLCDGKISFPVFCAVSTFSLLKYIRRVFRTKIWK